MSVNASLYVKNGWNIIKNKLMSITEFYTVEETVFILKTNDFYKSLSGKSKNRTLIKTNPKLYVSIYKHTDILKDIFKYSGNYNFTNRIKFLVEYNLDLNKLKCECGMKYGWTKYCRKCPSYHKTFIGKKHSNETKIKQRISALKYTKENIGKVCPRYNKKSISIIEEYGKINGYKFIHAENGGEYFIDKLGYYVDAYDPEKNVVLEIDENRHFKSDGSLKEKDIIRQSEIETYLKCKFIRLKYEDFKNK